ncbi:MAG: hypothetical protein PWQ20_1814 [Thermotogaceae bacterium]|jgi:hypothetical protein|nr:hypothetical protein [Thermotogaceae bacterium]
MLDRILKFAVVGNVISTATQRLKVPFIKPDHPIEAVSKGNVGIEMMLFDLYFDSFDEEKKFSDQIFIENTTKNGISLKNSASLSCQTLFRLCAVGLRRNCFVEEEFEKLVQESITFTRITHRSSKAILNGILISTAVSYILEKRETENLMDFLIDNVLNKELVRLDEISRKMIIMYLKNNEKSNFENILEHLKRNKNIVSNFSCTFKILPFIDNYFQIVEKVHSNFYTTEFFSTFLSLIYGILNPNDKDIDKFDEIIEKNEGLKKFLDNLSDKVNLSARKFDMDMKS